ncbi:MAG: hypothetical protein ACJ75H_00455 [Thermoanaerobaculia bacterium]
MFIAFVALLPWGCDQSGSLSHARAVVVWKKHESAVFRAVHGVEIGDEFGEACGFFSEVTGLEIRGDGSYFGWVPNGHTDEDFAKVKAWYAEKGNRLYWDDREQRVRVRGQKDGA